MEAPPQKLIAQANFLVVAEALTERSRPWAFDDSAITEQGNPVSIAILDNDFDPDEDPITIVARSQAQHGQVTADNSGLFTYVPNVGFQGFDYFTYTIDDNIDGQSSAFVKVEVLPPGSIPNAENDIAITNMVAPVSIDVLANDFDISGDVSLYSVRQPEHGKTSRNVDGTITYWPNSTFSGVDSFHYKIINGVSGTATGTVTVLVAAATGQAPLAFDETVSTLQNVSITVDVLKNDSDPDGDPLSIRSVLQPENGQTTQSDGGLLLYQPQSGFQGTDLIPYSIEDGNGGIASAVLVVTVSGNEPSDTVPLTIDLNAATPGDGSQTRYLSGAGPTSIVDPSIVISGEVTFLSATAQITNISNVGSETLSVDTAGTMIAANFDSISGLLSLSGEDSRENYRTVLRSLTYDNVSSTPSTAQRRIELQVTDGTDTSNIAVARVSIDMAVTNATPILKLPEPYDDNRFMDILVGELLSFVVTAVDTDGLMDGSDLRYELNLEQSGISDNAELPTITSPPASLQGGLFNWMPNESGTFRFSIQVRDTADAIAEEFITVTVTEPSIGSVIVSEDFEDDNLADSFENCQCDVSQIRTSISRRRGQRAFSTNFTNDGEGGRLDKTHHSFDSVLVSYWQNLPDGLPFAGSVGQSQVLTAEGEPHLEIDVRIAPISHEPARYEFHIANHDRQSGIEQIEVSFDLPTDEWFRTSYYLRYNDPGQTNGILKAWHNEQPIIERSDLVFLRNDNNGEPTEKRAGVVSVGGKLSRDGAGPVPSFERLVDDIIVSIDGTPPVAPELTLPPPYSTGIVSQAMVGQSIGFKVTATDIDGIAGDLQYEIDLQESGISPSDNQPIVDPASGDFSWVPSAPGVFDIDVRVVDVTGLADSKRISVHVVVANLTELRRASDQ